MTPEFLFCIPSYKRAGRQKTLDLLESMGCPKDWISLSVQTEEDRQAYTRAGVNKRVGAFLYRGGSCAADNFNTLLDYHSKGVKIVILEDDIKAIKRLTIDKATGKRKLVNVQKFEELLTLCRRGFAICRLEKTVGFGLSMTRNAMFMRPGHNRRKLCDTGFYGLINTDLRFDRNFVVLQDTDMCAQIIKRYGAFVSIDDTCADIDRFADGGCAEAWKRKTDMLKLLKRKHGDILEIIPSKENSVKLKRRKGAK